MTAPVTDDFDSLIAEVFPDGEPFVYYGTPDYDDDKPEPQIPVGDFITDRDGLPWTFTAFGWVAAGDGRPQSWSDIQKWFQS